MQTLQAVFPLTGEFRHPHVVLSFAQRLMQKYSVFQINEVMQTRAAAVPAPVVPVGAGVQWTDKQ